MKQNLTFNVSTIASTASKINVDAFDASVEAFDKKDYLTSFYYFLDYINGELRTKYGNADATEFNVPHGSIVVNIKLEDNQLKVYAPFLSVPKENRIPLLRQVAVLNMNNMDLAQIVLKDDKLAFEYSCPIELVNPYKIYYVFYEICITGDKYDDEFATKFGAERIYEPKITPYSQSMVDEVYGVIQASCAECEETVKFFESDRRYGYAWNMIICTVYKVLYYAHPQGQLMNDLDKVVTELDRNDIPLPEIVAYGKKEIEKLKAMTKEQLAEDLYFVETFIPPKRRSSLQNIQENFKNTYDDASKAYADGNYMAAAVYVMYKFYDMYYYNNVQDDVNDVVVDAMIKSSAKPWDVAAKALYTAMSNIMNGNLTKKSGGLFGALKGLFK